jgi:putative aldouronate transport system permease protein
MEKRIKGTAVKLSASDIVFYRVLDIFMIFILLIVAIPLWSTVTLSFRPNTFIGSNLEGMFLPPWKWSAAAYRALLGNNGFINAFLNSLKIFIMGVTSALFLTVPLAYVLSVKSLPGR